MSGEKIYVVEDEPLQRERIKLTLEDEGYEVTVFETVDKALAHMGWSRSDPHLTRNLPDAIITDNNTESAYTGMVLLGAAQERDIPRIMHAAGPTEIEVMAAGGKETGYIRKRVSDDREYYYQHCEMSWMPNGVE